MSLATDLAKARESRNVTQRALADYLHVKQATISMFESGELELGPELTTRIRDWVRSGSGISSSPSKRGPYSL